MTELTSKYVKLKRLFFFLSVVCVVAPLLFYFARAFVFGDIVQKTTMGITFTVALVLFMLNIIMKSHLRSVMWVLLIGIVTVSNHYISMLVVFAITTFVEELIFFPLYRYYKSKARINKEIDKRL